MLDCHCHWRHCTAKAVKSMCADPAVCRSGRRGASACPSKLLQPVCTARCRSQVFVLSLLQAHAQQLAAIAEDIAVLHISAAALDKDEGEQSLRPGHGQKAVRCSSSLCLQDKAIVQGTRATITPA